MEQVYKKIDYYLSSGRSTPLIVDVQNTDQLMDLRIRYVVGDVKQLEVSTFCNGDSMPNMSELYNNLSNRKGVIVLTELSTFLKLLGPEIVKSTLRELLDLPIKGKLIVLTYQCRDLLRYNDLRLMASNRIIIVEGEKQELPKITLLGERMSPSVDPIYNNISSLPRLIEENLSPEYYIKTKYNKKLFPKSLIGFKTVDDSYEMITIQFPSLSNLDKVSGTEEQWKYFLDELNKYESFEAYVKVLFGSNDNLVIHLKDFSSYTPQEKWTFYQALRYFGVGNDRYMNAVMSEATCFDVFIKRIFTTILEIDINKEDFNEIYQNRKKYISGLDQYASELNSFCKQVESKGVKGLYYLTDNTQQEKELIIKLIVEYEKNLHKDGILRILEKIYPALFYYLQPYTTGIDLLDGYLNLYKYCKLTNQILPEMRDMVEEQAVKRDYNSLLRPRSEYIDKMDKKKSILYFVDALGVEFMSFIQQVSFDKKLKIQVNIARCNLPSITDQNKEFIDSFQEEGCPLVDIKEIDDLKHHAPRQFNYQKTKLPIHITEELRIIKSLIEQTIYVDLMDGKYDKVVVVSDHGASRLVVINEKENKIEAEEKGEHSGRCCLKSDITEKPDNATDENGFWCIANYDQFKGGRKTGVEVHGGATLEEVAIPVIEFTLRDKDIECYILKQFRKISISFRKKARLEIFVGTESNDVTVLVDGIVHDAYPKDTKYIFSVDMPDIKNAGVHKLDVRVDGNIITKGLEFEIKKEGASERKFF